MSKELSKELTRQLYEQYKATLAQYLESTLNQGIKKANELGILRLPAGTDLRVDDSQVYVEFNHYRSQIELRQYRHFRPNQDNTVSASVYLDAAGKPVDTSYEIHFWRPEGVNRPSISTLIHASVDHVRNRNILGLFSTFNGPGGYSFRIDINEAGEVFIDRVVNNTDFTKVVHAGRVTNHEEVKIMFRETGIDVASLNQVNYDRLLAAAKEVAMGRVTFPEDKKQYWQLIQKLLRL